MRTSRQSKSKRTKRNNNNRGGWSAKAPNTSRVNMLGGFGDRYRTRLSYISHFTFTALTVTPSDQVMRGNSAFDPDFSGTGGQPNNYDDFALHYGSYRVYSSTIKCWVAMSTGQAELTVIPRRDTTSINTISLLENNQSEPYCKHLTVGPNSSARRGPTLTHMMQSQKLLAVPMVDTDMSALVSTNPTRAWYWHVVLNSFDFSTSTTAEVNVEVIYDVEFFVRLPGTLDLRFERILELRRIKAEFDNRRSSDNPRRVVECKEQNRGSDYVFLDEKAHHFGEHQGLSPGVYRDSEDDTANRLLRANSTVEGRDNSVKKPIPLTGPIVSRGQTARGHS